MHHPTPLKLLWLLRLNVASRSPYSPDLVPSDIYLFSKLKINIRGRNFGSNEGVIDAVDEYLGNQAEDKGWDPVKLA